MLVQVYKGHFKFMIDLRLLILVLSSLSGPVACFVTVEEPICFTDGRALSVNSANEITFNLCCESRQDCNTQLLRYCETISDEICDLQNLFPLVTCQEQRCVLCSIEGNCKNCLTSKDCNSGEICQLQCSDNQNMCESQCLPPNRP